MASRKYATLHEAGRRCAYALCDNTFDVYSNYTEKRHCCPRCALLNRTPEEKKRAKENSLARYREGVAERYAEMSKRDIAKSFWQKGYQKARATYEPIRFLEGLRREIQGDVR